MSLFTWAIMRNSIDLDCFFRRWCGDQISLSVDTEPSSHRKVTCCFYTHINTHILNSLSGRLMKREVLREKYGDVWIDACSQSKCVCASSVPFSVIHSLLVFDSDACQCPAAVGLERNHLAQMHF